MTGGVYRLEGKTCPHCDSWWTRLSYISYTDSEVVRFYRCRKCGKMFRDMEDMD